MYDIQNELTLEQKLEILADAAKYDVACTSSGVDRRGQKGMLGNSCAAGVCHSFSADGRCISLLKIVMTNHCVFDCKYCKNRHSNDVPRATFTPDEICTLTIEFYKRNYIEGLFLSSGILKNPDYTMEKICEALRLLRTKYHFNGYIHVKAIPGASQELIYSAGLLADRISINMELPTQSSLQTLAPSKSMQTILKPMNQISETIAAHRLAIGKDARMERSGINRHLLGSIFGPESVSASGQIDGGLGEGPGKLGLEGSQWDPAAYNRRDNAVHTFPGDIYSSVGYGRNMTLPADRRDTLLKRPFAPAGQSTQMIIGATGETDYELIQTTQQLYKSFDLKRVFFSGYIPINDDEVLPRIGTPVPRLREHRLYQADWLLRFYGFQADELLSKESPNFDNRIDPKCNWALRHLGSFPVEVNRASYDELIRVPGIGPKGVKKIMDARRYGSVNFEMLKKMHIALNRACYFITCNGKMMGQLRIDEQFILNRMLDIDRPEVMQLEGEQVEYRQMNLFRDFNYG